ncbi:MAG: putative permease super family, partial [Bacteroidetes bacterium]|nr:putative permease super family [Bacteroidota bacterium]
MPFLGELSALLTACLWSGGALAFAAAAAATKRAGSFQVNITRLILAAVYLVLLILIAGFNVNLSNTQILYLSLSGVVGLTFGDTFLFKAFHEIGARVTMLIMSIAPAIAALLAYLILGETLSTAGVLGVAITILGVSIVVTDRGGPGPEKIVLTTSGIVFAMLAAVGQGSGLVFAKIAFEEGEVNGFVATAVRI